MYSLIHLFRSEDTDGLSRVDRSLLPQQTLMELFFDGFENKSNFQNHKKEYKDLSKIEGIAEKDDTVSSVDLFLKELDGTLHVKWLPCTVAYLDLARNGLLGTLDLAEIPESMIAMRLDRNKLSGSLDLTQLPEMIKVLMVATNSFSGSIDLKGLPKSLTVLDLSENNFDGQIDFSFIKKTVEWGSISSLFYGFWRESAPPESVDGRFIVNFFKNAFSGDILVKDVSLIKHRKPFTGLECRYVVDSQGTRKPLEEYPKK